MLNATRVGGGSGLMGLGVTGEGCEKAATIMVDGYRYGGDICPKSGNLYVSRFAHASAPPGTSGWKALRKSIGPTVAKKWESSVGWSESAGRPSKPDVIYVKRIADRLAARDGIGDYNSINDFYVYFFDKNGQPLNYNKLMEDLVAGRSTELSRAVAAKIGIYRDVPSTTFWQNLKSVPSTVYNGIETIVKSVCGRVADPKAQAAAYAAATAAAATGVGAGVGAATAAAAAICGAVAGGGSAPPVPVPTGATAPGTTTPPMPATTSYVGGIAALDPKTGLYRVAMPSGLADLGAAPFTLITASSPSPGGATLVTAADFDAKTGLTPWFKKPMTYAIAGGALAAIMGGVFLLRRRR